MLTVIVGMLFLHGLLYYFYINKEYAVFTIGLLLVLLLDIEFITVISFMIHFTMLPIIILIIVTIKVILWSKREDEECYDDWD